MNNNEFVENDNESDYESIIDEESTIDLLNNNKIKKINLNEFKLFICNWSGPTPSRAFNTPPKI